MLPTQNIYNYNKINSLHNNFKIRSLLQLSDGYLKRWCGHRGRTLIRTRTVSWWLAFRGPASPPFFLPSCSCHSSSPFTFCTTGPCTAFKYPHRWRSGRAFRSTNNNNSATNSHHPFAHPPHHICPGTASQSVTQWWSPRRRMERDLREITKCTSRRREDGYRKLWLWG